MAPLAIIWRLTLEGVLQKGRRGRRGEKRRTKTVTEKVPVC